MSSDTLLKDADGVTYSYDNISTGGYLTGHVAGLDAAANYLNTRAIELFKLGKHQEAIDLQKLSKAMVEALEPEMRKRMAEHTKDYPAVVDG